MKHLEIGFIQFGVSELVIGVCLFDKYCWTNVYGFEIFG